MKMRFVAVCIVFACFYGVLHDQVTARICLEYFTIWHPELVESQDPTVVAFAWGIVATWWVGLILGIPLALVCRAGRRVKLTVREVMPLLGWLFLGMTVCAVLAGLVGYLFAPEDNFAAMSGYKGPNNRGFVTNLFAHEASYFSGFVGGAIVIFAARIKRMKRGYAEGV